MNRQDSLFFHKPQVDKVESTIMRMSTIQREATWLWICRVTGSSRAENGDRGNLA